MNAINVVTIGKLIAAHREGDEEKFRAYVEFIAEAYEQQGNDRAANIIRSNYTGGSYRGVTKTSSEEEALQRLLKHSADYAHRITVYKKDGKTIKREVAEYDQSEKKWLT